MYLSRTYEKIGLVATPLEQTQMQITISFHRGFHVQGVVLSATGTRLRVAMQNWDDTAEFQCSEGRWFSENRDPVEIACSRSLLALTVDSAVLVN